MSHNVKRGALFAAPSFSGWLAGVGDGVDSAAGVGTAAGVSAELAAGVSEGGAGGDGWASWAIAWMLIDAQNTKHTASPTTILFR